MTLISWIRKHGVEKVANLLEVDKSTVGKWKNLKSVPQFDNAYKIKMLTHGKLGFNEIYGPYFKKQIQNQNS